ncbi:MAG: grasp-with-spasm system ATP-grasp peptide maturase [Chryseobacterium sp.]|jgi:ATP-GRASP peptide maturase of grasp-with-spasm system|uniref:grasp-with-spasm system ATP-grasp peptide maturase n=1 Tax=Chryseobacterium sp. TaxID=1871047 RepID=UPI002820FAF2|nr:grasp-with-spasm system ATP-grasp peptide maturase [Chryseobacterium sp.]MDR2237553.1 grasp-with-spasm system ATP-grasp peptide maturase [Chryseobacterium sp.]
MILIISENKEATTTEVIRWLVFLNKDFIRVHEDEVFEIKMENKRIYLESKKNSFFIDEISNVWYRRGGLRFLRYKYKNEAVNIHMNEHQHWLEGYVRHYLEKKSHINKQSIRHLNKLIVLDIAKEVGFDVPKYFLSDTTSDMQLNNTITKTIAGNGILQFENEDYDGIMYTSVVTKEEKKDFFITFFQEKIEKDFEIRAFYLNDKIWSMAIFSQNDDQTKIDYRKYNNKIPNRNVPYTLPNNIEEKIKILMKELGLNSGSIDFIKKGNQYYFLEVNAIGQFGNVSYYSNYNLHYEIAKIL